MRTGCWDRWSREIVWSKYSLEDPKARNPQKANNIGTKEMGNDAHVHEGQWKGKNAVSFEHKLLMMIRGFLKVGSCQRLKRDVCINRNCFYGDQLGGANRRAALATRTSAPNLR